MFQAISSKFYERMDAFITGLIVLAIMGAMFYIVLFSFIFYWHLKKISFVIVPFIWAFEYFAIGFFVVSLVAIIIQYLPELVRVSGI